jgi:OPA family sugar phosphate sensor protein UhpC-like MFS transporter
LKFFNIFNSGNSPQVIEDQEVVKQQYKYWRIRMFYSMYVGYAAYYLTRKSFVFAMPAMVKDLGMDKTELGILLTILALTYGVSKFLSGIVSDKSNPRYFMSLGLILTGVFNILFGFSSSFMFFAIFWGFNGLFQGWGAPPCAKLLTYWYSQSERGSWWSTWNTSHNAGGALIPLLSSYLIEHYNWRIAMFTPGIISIVLGLFLMQRLRDTPQSLGLPPVEKFRNEPSSSNIKETDTLSVKEILVDHVLSNRYIWMIAIAFFFVYIVRQAMNDWSQLFLMETKGYSALAAGSCIFWFEIGGFFGSIVSGWSSDWIFKGKRGPVNVIFIFFVLFAVFWFWQNQLHSIILDSALLFAIGFFIFGPQMLMGVAAVEFADKKAAGTTTGFIGWIAYAGAAIAGVPLGSLIKNYGWQGFFVAMAACSIIAFTILLPLWNKKAKGQEMADEKEAA